MESIAALVQIQVAIEERMLLVLFVMVLTLLCRLFVCRFSFA